MFDRLESDLINPFFYFFDFSTIHFFKIKHLRKRKHFLWFCRVIETRVEVWEKEKYFGNTSPRQVFPQLFRVNTENVFYFLNNDAHATINLLRQTQHTLQQYTENTKCWKNGKKERLSWKHYFFTSISTCSTSVSFNGSIIFRFQMSRASWKN